MVEKEKIYDSKVKYKGYFIFKDFYQFCYDWLTEETDLILSEDKYKEKITGDTKTIEVKWTGWRKITDYFKFEVKLEPLRVSGLKDVEVVRNGKKVKMQWGYIEMMIKGTLIRDWQGKFEKDAFRKFLRAIYERWIIPQMVDKFEDKLAEDCDEYASQAKAFLGLESER